MAYLSLLNEIFLSVRIYRFDCHRRRTCRLLGGKSMDIFWQFYPSAFHNDTICSDSIHWFNGDIIIIMPISWPLATCAIMHEAVSMVFNMASMGLLLSERL